MRLPVVFVMCILIVLLLPRVSSAQTLISQDRAPQVGDTLYYQTDELPQRITISPPGKNQLWNFTSLLAPYLQTEIVAGNSSQIQVGGAAGTKDVFEIQGKGLIWKSSTGLYVGKAFINQLWQSTEGIPLPSWDMSYQDDIDFESPYFTVFAARDMPRSWQNSIPNGTDSLKILLLMTRSMTVDGMGTLMLAGGSRHNVNRLRVEDLISKRLLVKKGGRWTDITGSARLNDLLPEKTLAYHFISQEGGGTVCSVQTDLAGKPNSVHFYVPKEQARVTKNIVPSQWLYAYPNPAPSVVRFKFLDIPPGQYTIRFYDILLRKLLEKSYTISGSETVEININQLQKGTYLFSLIDQYGKKLVTKRLIVIKP